MKIQIITEIVMPSGDFWGWAEGTRYVINNLIRKEALSGLYERPLIDRSFFEKLLKAGENSLTDAVPGVKKKTTYRIVK